jgi:hypothetical protein
MKRLVIRVAILCVLSAAALGGLPPAVPAHADNVCLDNNCYDEVDYCTAHGWYYSLITDEHSSEYNPNNPNATLDVELQCYDDRLFVRHWTRCSY